MTLILDANKSLEERKKFIPNSKREQSMSITFIHKFYENLLRSLPVWQLRFMAENVKHMKFIAGVPATAKQSQSADYGLVLSFDEIYTLMKASKEQCLTCTRDCRSAKKCHLKHVLDTIGVADKHMNPVTHDGGECGYKWL